MKTSMKSALNFLTGLSAALVFTGCAMPDRIEPGKTSADELIRQLGQPTTKRPGAAGSEDWDYVYGPAGIHTWRYNVDGSRNIRSATQLLTEERLQKLVPGQSTEKDVLEMLGQPRDTGRVGGEMTWEWRVHLPPQYGVYVVRFGNDGKVSGVNILPDMIIDGGSPDP